MRTEHLLISLTTLLLGLLLFFLGAFLLASSFFPALQDHFSLLLKEQVLGKIGASLMLFSCILLSTFYFLSKRRYLLIEMGGVFVRDRVLAEIAESSLRNFFPNEPISCEVVLHKKGKVEILAHLPYVSDEEKEERLLDIERHLTLLFTSKCGLNREFLFNVSFGKVS